MHINLLKRVIFLALSLTTIAIAFGKESAEEQARPLLKQAEEHSLLHPDKAFPFGLLLKYSIQLPRSKPLPGVFSWLVTSEGDSRKEIRFADYSELNVLRGTTLWVKRSSEFRPLQSGWVAEAMGSFVLMNSPHDEIKRYFTASDHQTRLRCVELLRNKTARTLCFDPEANLHKIEMQDSHTTYEFSDFRQVGAKSAPYKVIVKRDGSVVLEGTIDVLTPNPTVEPSLLMIPPDAIKRNGCLISSFPLLKDKVRPQYPQPARERHIQGTVTAYVLVGSDGSVKQTAILQTGGEYLDESVLDAVRKWQYEPAKCETMPVESEQEVTVNFTLEILR